MKQSYTTSFENPSLNKLAFFALLVALLYAGVFYALSNHSDSISTQKISQLISVDSLSKERPTTNPSVFELFPSKDNDISSNSHSNSSENSTFNKGSQSFRFLGAILQVLLNFYRL